MLTIFNRKEIAVTFSMQEQARIKNILAQNNIESYIKVINRKSPSPFSAGSRATTGTLGENLALEYEYIIYVHDNIHMFLVEKVYIIIESFIRWNGSHKKGWL